MQNKFDFFFKRQSIVQLHSIRFFIVIVTFFTIISSCGIRYNPVETFEGQDKKRHEKAEAYLKSKYPDKEYSSLAFGTTIVYKPPSFNTLDSLYAVKKEYIDNDELRELKTSGVEEMIEAYRPKAQEDLDQVEYEFEHIYYLAKNDSIEVNHDFFVFNYKDSIITYTPFYNYSIPSNKKEVHNSYLFEFHFTTDRDLYISQREKDFLSYFKAREEELIREPELDSFINHTLKLMTLANRINSIDFKLLSQHISLKFIKNISNDAIIESFGTLIALEDSNNNVIGYERTIKWSEKDKIYETTITFNQYLELDNMKTITKES